MAFDARTQQSATDHGANLRSAALFAQPTALVNPDTAKVRKPEHDAC